MKLTAACTAADTALHKGRAEWFLAAASFQQMDEDDAISEKDKALIREAKPHLEKAIDHFKQARQGITKLQDLARPIKDNKAFLQSMSEAAKLVDTLIEHTEAQAKQASSEKLAGESAIIEIGKAFARLDERIAENAKRRSEK
jgi:hypothetical protein